MICDLTIFLDVKAYKSLCKTINEKICKRMERVGGCVNHSEPHYLHVNDIWSTCHSFHHCICFPNALPSATLASPHVSFTQQPRQTCIILEPAMGYSCISHKLLNFELFWTIYTAWQGEVVQEHGKGRWSKNILSAQNGTFWLPFQDPSEILLYKRVYSWQ